MSAQARDDYCIGEGGPLRRFEVAARLTSLRRQILVTLAVTWLPVMLFGLLDELVTGRRELLLRDPSFHVRLLVAAPVFLILDQLFPRVCRRMLEQLVAQGFVPESARPRFALLVQKTMRLADSPRPELVLALLSIGLGVAALFGLVPASGLRHRTGLTAAQLWYGVTDWPLFQFLLWRSLWRWGIWVRILIGLSRIDLDLVTTHPDRRGGIAFLRIPSVGYCAMLLFAVSSVLCAEYHSSFSFGATVDSFKPLLALFAVIGALVALGPLLLFAPQLVAAHRAGLDECGGLATGCGRHFRKRWIVERGRDEPIDGRDLQPLVDVGETFRETVDRFTWLLFGKRDILVLLAATLLPTVPVMLAHVPGEDWRELLGLVSGR